MRILYYKTDENASISVRLCKHLFATTIYLGLSSHLLRSGLSRPCFVMQGYDDMDLARLLERWAEEYYWTGVNPEITALEDFFDAKLKDLCKEYAEKTPEQDESKTEEPQKVILVERDYKGEYERFALTFDEFRKEYPATYAEFGPFEVACDINCVTISPLVHICFQPCTVGDEDWTKFFSDMEWGLPQSDIDSGNLATIRLDLFGKLKSHISLSTYIRANEHSDANKFDLVKEWKEAKRNAKQ